MAVETLEELLREELNDLYDAEKQLTHALPKMAKAAQNPELKKGFEEHLAQTNEHIARLEQVFELMGVKAKGKPCAAMKGLVEEAGENIKEKGDSNLHDALLISSAQRVEHYEIAGYGNVRAIADALGKEDIADLLQSTLDEERETDEKLTEIGEDILTQAAQAGSAKKLSSARK